MPALNITIADDEISFLENSENLSFDSTRREILKSLNSIDVQACPGSGKTTLVAAKLILLAKKWEERHRGICVISHTNVAKDEIIRILKNAKSNEARQLLAYPHFIGTIQDFVDKFIALPYVRQEFGFNKFLEEDEGTREVLLSGEDINCLCKSLYQMCGKANYDDIKAFLGSLFWLENTTSPAFYAQFGGLISPSSNSKVIYPKLLALKNRITSKGFFQYRDMYAYANEILEKNPKITEAIKRRFPAVFIDEFQDTQKFQDDILQKIFPIDSPEISVQRFGDPDQAILSGINNESPNVSYNGKPVTDMDFVIQKSHRFQNEIARKIRKLSFNEVNLESELSPQDLDTRTKIYRNSNNMPHTIFLYDESHIAKVVPKFLSLVSSSFEDTYKRQKTFKVKVIGAVGREIEKDTDLRIASYWESYSRKKAIRTFKESCLIEAVYHVRSNLQNQSGNYVLLNNCMIKLLRLSGVTINNTTHLSQSNFKKHLISRSKWGEYRKLMTLLLLDRSQIDEDGWSTVKNKIVATFELQQLNDATSSYLSYLKSSNSTAEKPALPISLANTLAHEDEFLAEFSTIHGAKGETHDATLVLETKNYCPDIHAMIAYLAGNSPTGTTPNTSLKQEPTTGKKNLANQKFMRQLYVAVSRPKHLLCIAMHKDHLTDVEENSLTSLGWNIERVFEDPLKKNI